MDIITWSMHGHVDRAQLSDALQWGAWPSRLPKGSAPSDIMRDIERRISRAVTPSGEQLVCSRVDPHRYAVGVMRSSGRNAMSTVAHVVYADGAFGISPLPSPSEVLNPVLDIARPLVSAANKSLPKLSQRQLHLMAKRYVDGDVAISAMDGRPFYICSREVSEEIEELFTGLKGCGNDSELIVLRGVGRLNLDAQSALEAASFSLLAECRQIRLDIEERREKGLWRTQDEALFRRRLDLFNRRFDLIREHIHALYVAVDIAHEEKRADGALFLASSA